MNAKRLRALLRYNPLTGVFTCLKARGALKVGDVAGSYRKDGYLLLCIEGKRYLGQRLAWLYMTGEWPEHEVDHKDRKPSNNKWRNLRAATHKQNLENCKLRTDNTSGIKGVHWNKSRQNWMAYVHQHGRFVNLGGFSTKRVAKAARRDAERHVYTHAKTA